MEKKSSYAGIQALNILLLALVVVGECFGQGVNVNTAPPPGPIISVSQVGAVGFAQYTYVVVAKYPAGTAASFAVSINNGNPTLNSTNKNVIGWQALPGVLTYDILRVPNSGYTGSCTCSLAVNQTATTYTDIGGSLSAYTQAAAAGAAVSTLFLDNVNYAFPKLRVVINGGTVHLAEVPSGNALPVYCTIGDIFVLNILSGSSAAGLYRCSAANTWTAAGGGSGSGTVNSGTATHIAYYASTGTAVSSDPAITDNGTQVGITEPLAIGATPPAVTGTGIIGLGETTGQGCVSTADCVIADSATHKLLLSNNNGTALPISQTVANGTSALGTGAIGSGACATVVTGTATGTATSDNIMADFSADPTSTTGYSASANGMLTIIKYPTANTINFKVCNNTGGSITPGAVTLNWRVVR